MDSEKGFPPIPPSELPGPEWFEPSNGNRLGDALRDSVSEKLHIVELQSFVRDAGAQWLGIQQSLLGKPELVMFRDPVTGSTCAVEKEQCSVDTVKAALERKRQQFKTEEEH